MVRPLESEDVWVSRSVGWAAGFLAKMFFMLRLTVASCYHSPVQFSKISGLQQHIYYG